MNIERLVTMANDIGDFFKAEPDREDAVAGIQNHLQRYWVPRMRVQIRAYAEGGGEGLAEPVKEAILRLSTPAAPGTG
jgi:formate dehydrogenase subunit delta